MPQELDSDTKPTQGAFVSCEPCGGMGFTRKGDFADRKFTACDRCEGTGQKYLDPRLWKKVVSV